MTQAQSKLPALLKEVNERGTAYGISVREDVKAYLVSKERMKAITETVEILANRDAAAAIRDYEAGKTRFHPIDILDE
ncbi:MAG: prevent-host-death protein [Verrucomicrobiota bacterium]